MATRRKALLLLTCLAACGDGSGLARPGSGPDVWLETWVAPDIEDAVDTAEATADTVLDGDTTTIEGTCGEGLRVVRVEAWPGGGVAAVVALRGEAPVTWGGVTATLDGAPASIAPAPAAPGVTGILLVDVARRDEALAFLDALPAGEVVVVWAGAELAAEATPDHAHARRRLAAATLRGAPDPAALVDDLTRLGGPIAAAARTLVVAGDAPIVVAGPVEVVALSPGLADALVARRSGLARVGACPSGSAGARLPLTVAGVTCELTLPEPDDSVAALPCDAAAAAADVWPRTDRIDIVLDAAETATWEQRKRDKSKEDFTGKLRLDGGAALPAVLHFRGQTSLDCARKSYNVDLDGPTRRRLAPGVASGELFLVAMCKDVGHYNQVLGDRLAAAQGWFPLGMRLVNLFVNDLDQGVYLLLEDPIEGLRDDATDVAAIIRRRLDQDGNAPEVEHSDVDDAWAMAAYDAMVASAADGIAALEARLDLDGYLGWMALQVMLHNGDYVDEVLFHGALEAGADHPWFRVMGWDPDDLWSDCHRNGVAAIPDPHGILYCAEANIDHVLFADAAVYARFVDHLDALLSAYPMERMTAEMAAVRDLLFARVGADATAAAMVELTATHPEAATAEGYKRVVEGLMNADLDRHAVWRAELLDKIAAYREGR